MIKIQVEIDGKLPKLPKPSEEQKAEMSRVVKSTAEFVVTVAIGLALLWLVFNSGIIR